MSDRNGEDREDSKSATSQPGSAIEDNHQRSAELQKQGYTVEQPARLKDEAFHFRSIAAEIEKAGGQAIVPVLDQRFKVEAFRSNWSERHAAFIAGLGTFSLNKSIITECGAAGRVGTIITDMAFEPTGRNYTLYDEYCTKCGACIKRCPVECITLQGKDNTVCSKYLDQTLAMYKPSYGCGKCQTKVPCENKRPKK